VAIDPASRSELPTLVVVSSLIIILNIFQWNFLPKKKFRISSTHPGFLIDSKS